MTVHLTNAERAAVRIWTDLSDRRGFGLNGLEHDDPLVYDQIIRTMAGIIEDETERQRP